MAARPHHQTPASPQVAPAPTGQRAPMTTLAPPRKTFQVESLLSGPIDVLTLLHYLHAKQATPLRDLLVGMLGDLQLSDVDQILPQLVHLWVCWEAQQARMLTEFFLAQCAKSLHLTLKLMWILHAEEAHAPPGSRALARIGHMLKQAEMAHVNAEIPTASAVSIGQPRTEQASAAARLAGALRRSATQNHDLGGPDATRRTPPLSMRSSTSPSLNGPGRPVRGSPPVAAVPSPSPVNRAARIVTVQFAPAILLPHQPQQDQPLVCVRIVLAERVVLSVPGGGRPPSSPGSNPSPAPPGRQRASTTSQTAPRRMEGPAAAFTNQNSWTRSAATSVSGSPPHLAAASRSSSVTAPRPPPAVRAYSPSPAQLRLGEHSVFNEQYFASPTAAASVSPNPLSPSPLPPAAAAAADGLAQPSMARLLSDEEVHTQSAFLSPRPSSAVNATSPVVPSPAPAQATPASGGTTPSPELDVDWPAADQDIPSAAAPAAATAVRPRSGEPQRNRGSISADTSALMVPSRGPLTPRRYATLGARRDALGSPPSANGRALARSDGSAGADGVAEPVLFHLLSKQVRSEYFNLQLLLLATMHDLSKALTAVTPTDRNRVLREQLLAIDASILRGLYLPLVPATGDGRHYRILRLLPDDCWSLASRDKAPFLLHVEIAYASSPPTPASASAPASSPVSPVGQGATCYASDLYTTYKSNGDIMRDAMAVAAVGAARDAANPGAQHAQAADLIASDELGQTGDAARSTAAHIADMKDAAVDQAQQANANATAHLDVTQADARSRASSTTPATPVATSEPTSPLPSGPASTTSSGSNTTVSSPRTSVTSAPTSTSLVTKASSVVSSSQTVPATKGTGRLVPQANPFRPQRSAAYPAGAGPTLCDQEFETLSAAFGESLMAKKARIHASSPFVADTPADRWDVVSVIFKGGDDLRQEVLALQLIATFDRIWKKARLPLFLRPYSVVITSADSGLIETLSDSVSLDSLKKRLSPHWTCLADFFAAYFGGAELAALLAGPAEFAKRHPSASGLVGYQNALRNFVESMAGSSVVTYILAVKDRHNGNIMLDREGHIIHIDFGFMLVRNGAQRQPATRLCASRSLD